LKFCNGMFGFANPNIKLIVVHWWF
jgi:hypothetical protein